jgi:hypothetical protein
MNEKYLIVEIIEYIDDGFPGWVRCKFIDAFGKTWNINEKVPVVSSENILSNTILPETGYVAGEILNEENGIICFSTEKPYYIESDDGAYNIYENRKGVLLLGCWAYARRKFEQALKNDPARAGFALEQIRLLYRLERRAEEGEYTKEETERLRKEEAYPILRAFENRLDANYSQVLPKSPIGQAITYTYNIYPRLVRYVIDGRYRIDNNEAAKRTAIIYSLLGTCKINNVNPAEWLTDVLIRINDCKTNDLAYLLPDHWRKSEGV